MDNLLLETVLYKTEETRWGVWRRFLYPSGDLFEKFTSHRRVFGVPLLHYTRGKCPETGKRVVASGVVAVGRFAVGIVAIGQVAAGFIAVGQLALSPLLGVGQAAAGAVAVGQLAVAAALGLGQAATGFVAVGQFGLGRYVLAQMGLGTNVWDTWRPTPPPCSSSSRCCADKALGPVADAFTRAGPGIAPPRAARR